MNVDNGQIFMGNEEIIKLMQSEGKNVFAVPDELEQEAMIEFKRQMQEQTPLNLSGNSPLASWAAQKRQEQAKKQNKKKRKAKIAKMSRARNH